MTESARNLSDLQDAIHAKHGKRAYLSPAAMWEAAALWGVTPRARGSMIAVSLPRSLT